MPRHTTGFDHEPTWEEVEQMVAAQMAALPAWWAKGHQPRTTRPPYVRPVVCRKPTRRPSTVESKR